MNLLSSPVQCGCFVWHWHHNSLLSQRKIFNCKDDLVERPCVPHTPCEPAGVYPLPIMFSQGRGEETRLQEKLWLEQPHRSPSFSAPQWTCTSTLLSSTYSELSAIASEQTAGSLHWLVAGLEYFKGKFSPRSLLPHFVELHPQYIGWNKMKENNLFQLKENKYNS